MKRVKFNIFHLVILLYLIFSIFINKLIDLKTYNLIINPIFWLIISISIYIRTGNNHGRFSKLNENEKTILITTLFYLIINFMSGLIFGYTSNPYSNKLIPFLTNFWQIVIVIMGIEYTRSYIINENKNNKLFVILFTIIFILLEINFSKLFSSINDREELFKYVSSTLLPLIFGNILYTYLTIKGSYKLVYIYRVIVEVTFLIVPILPNFDWFMIGIRGIIVPAIIYLVLKYTSNYKSVRTRSNGRKKQNPLIYVPVFSIILIFVLFMAGIFIYEPIAVLSNSMNPVFYRGDVVIYSKVDNNKLKNIKKYNIIIYSKDGQAVVHRVVDKYIKDGETYFITKGDANISNDLNPVSESQVIGVYQLSIKYIGYPSVWLNQIFNYEKPNVEIK